MLGLDVLQPGKVKIQFAVTAQGALSAGAAATRECP
jgi:hypothetical protein